MNTLNARHTSYILCGNRALGCFWMTRSQRLRKAGTWPVSARVLPEQSGGEGNSSSRLRFLIFAGGFDFFLTAFVLSAFTCFSLVDF